MSDWYVVWPIVLPAIAASCAVAVWGRERLQNAFLLLGATAQGVMALLLFLQVRAQGPVAMDMGGWPAPFGVSFVATEFGAGLTVTASVTALSILVYGMSLGASDKKHPGFAPLLLVLLTGVAGAFLTADIFNLYVWFEVTLITALGLLVVGGTSEQLGGALKYALPNLFATTLLLIATALLYGMTGTLNMPDLATKIAALPDSAALQTVAMMFLLALGMKSALFPLAFWLPASYHTAGPTVAAVFGALLTKVGVYAMIQVFLTLFAAHTLIARDIMAAATVGPAVWYDAGSQNAKGNSADFIPSASKNIIATVCSAAESGSAAIFVARSGMFRVPVIPYRSAVAIRRSVVANRLGSAYLSAPPSCSDVPPTTRSPRAVISVTSNQTYRLKMSAVRNAPATPVSNTRSRGANPGCFLSLAPRDMP
ncbi:MAG: proton-conducting transporter membrane subunit [Myxococcota bacterium]